MTIKMRFILIPVLLVLATPATAELAGSTRDGVYQIVKATDSRVWRLNTQTGEIAVCSLEGENLVCTTSTDAADVPKKSYEQIEAERKAAEEAAKAKYEADRERELKFLDKILALFRELLATAMGKSDGG
ncbi:MAG: hypothetical protein JJ900_00705 [Rhodospirillales bacterium]|nr:hypothetical protein [Rhodospirillales bacterium]MBO6785337.1 hypothetical protein [Rhodospirillales bacterium]